jgi:hypothetical protein
MALKMEATFYSEKTDSPQITCRFSPEDCNCLFLLSILHIITGWLITCILCFCIRAGRAYCQILLSVLILYELYVDEKTKAKIRIELARIEGTGSS